MRIDTRIQNALIAVGMLLSLSGFAGNANSQTADLGSSATASQENQPLLLIVQNQGQIPAPSQKEWHVLLADTLKEALSQSTHYRLMVLSPHLPVVKTALREHSIAMADLVEPYQKETLERLANVFGAKYILSFGAVNGKDNLSLSVRFEQYQNAETWITSSAQEVTTANRIGKRRLKKIELVDLAVDKITAAIGAPSHLADSLITTVELKDRVKKPKETPIDKVKPAVKEHSVSVETPITSETNDDQTSIKSVENKVPVELKPVQKVTKSNKEKLQTGADSPRPVKLPSPHVPSAKAKTVGEADTTKPTESAVRFTTDTSPSQNPPTNLPEISPPPGDAKMDFEAEAARFRQSGDLANGILSLRRAINERPKDIGLRRLLIQAYQDVHMPEDALRESSRARKLAPKDSGLIRMQGDALLARGDSAGALKAYTEAADLDPNDIDAQVALGNAFLASQQFPEAVNAYLKAAKNAPKSPLPHRRLARAYLGRAGGDSKQYTPSLEEIKLAHDLTPADDRENYLDDYLDIMRVMGGRLKEMTDQLQNIYQAHVGGQLSAIATKRTMSALKDRAEAASAYLDRLLPAPTQEATNASFQQSAALLLQAGSLYNEFLLKGTTSTEEAYKSAQLDTFRALSLARERLDKIRVGRENPKAPESAVVR